MTVELEQIPPEDRECELMATYEAVWPGILGSLLDLLAKVLGALPDIKRDRWPRMADFAKVLPQLTR